MYYDTVKETKENKIEYSQINDKQDAMILEYARKARIFSSATIENKLNILPSSVSRSVNSLKRLGYIEETGNRIMGNRGRNIKELKVV